MGHEPHTIRDAGQLTALRAPVRQRIVSALAELGEAAVADIAAHLGERADKLYYHVHQLVDAGLLQTAGQRAGRRRPQTLFRLSRPGFLVDSRARGAKFLDALGAVYGTAIREAHRNLDRALLRERDRRRDRDRPTGVLTAHARLRPEHVAAVRRRLLELADWIAAHDDPTAERYAVTAIATPIVPPPRGADELR